MIDSEGFTVSYHQRLDVEESVESYTCQKMPKIGQDNILLGTTSYLSLFIKSWPPFNKAKSRSHSVDTRSCFWCHMRLNTMEKSSNTSACLCTHSLTCLCNFDQNTLHTQQWMTFFDKSACLRRCCSRYNHFYNFEKYIN